MTNPTLDSATKCQLGEEPFYQCCCNCRHHVQDFHHCTIHTAMREKEGKCICGVQKGWVCVGFRDQGDGSEGVHSEWPEHSAGCEMYTPIRKIERPKEPA